MGDTKFINELGQFWYASKSEKMSDVKNTLLQLRKVSMQGEQPEPTLLLLGDSGTEKSQLAHMIHIRSRAGKGPWVSINCATIPANDLEKVFFGQDKDDTGVTTGVLEQAQNGTLYIENLEFLDPTFQTKLAQALSKKNYHRLGSSQQLSVRTRLICTFLTDSPRNREKVQHELINLISQTTLRIPTLKERKADLASMAKVIGEKAFQEQGKTFPGFSPETEKAIENYEWPGNYSELLAAIERASLVAKTTQPLTTTDLLIPSTRSEPPTASLRALPSQPATVTQLPLSQNGHSGMQVPAPVLSGEELTFTEIKKRWSDSFEREYITNALNRNGGNVSAAAREARLDRSNFLRLMRRHGIKSKEYRKIAA